MEGKEPVRREALRQKSFARSSACLLNSCSASAHRHHSAPACAQRTPALPQARESCARDPSPAACRKDLSTRSVNGAVMASAACSCSIQKGLHQFVARFWRNLSRPPLFDQARYIQIMMLACHRACQRPYLTTCSLLRAGLRWHKLWVSRDKLCTLTFHAARFFGMHAVRYVPLAPTWCLC